MANLTTEYLDKKFGQIDKKFDNVVKELKSYTDTRVGAAVKELKGYANEKQDEMATMVNKGFEDVLKRLDVKDRMDKLEKKVEKVYEALHL